MSFIDTDGRSARFLTRAQKRAITIESAPRSWKKWLSTDTCSTRMTSASTSASALSVLLVGPANPPWVVEDPARSAAKTSTDSPNGSSISTQLAVRRDGRRRHSILFNSPKPNPCHPAPSGWADGVAPPPPLPVLRRTVWQIVECAQGHLWDMSRRRDASLIDGRWGDAGLRDITRLSTVASMGFFCLRTRYKSAISWHIRSHLRSVPLTVSVKRVKRPPRRAVPGHLPRYWQSARRP